MGKKKDCGCGRGSKNCISKQSLVKWVEKEMKKLDCGCGCDGKKGFCKKYGIVPYKRKLVGGKILADCPPGWRNDGLTCVEPCAADEYDDGLTCRKKCEPGWINDGLTCRKPITSSMNECPPGSRDIAGTCWGPVRKDCIDDCFKHPAPGCRTWQCGRLRWAGVDWGPKWCTDCNLRCGQTCWDVQGITKQLHQRNLKLMGGEVIGQRIRGKQIRGRVNFDSLLKEITAGIKDLFEGNIDLAAAFDPERNGIAAAMRKFGNDIERVLKEVGDNIKKGFENLAADTKKAFEDFAKNAERDFKQFGEDFVHKMRDPDFWVEAVGIMAQVAAVALGLFATVITAGIGAPALAGLMAAAAMAGPAAKMIADGARGRPIDALDIAQLVISGASAAVPGMGDIVGPMVKYGGMAASFAIEAVKVGQALDKIPSTCIANCPAPPPPRGPIIVEDGPPPPPIPPLDPLPENQLTDEQITKLGKDIDENIFRAMIKTPPPKRDNPDYISQGNWIALFRHTYYGTPYTGPQSRLIDEVDFEAIDFNTGEPDEIKLPPADELIPPMAPSEPPPGEAPPPSDFDFEAPPPAADFDFDAPPPAADFDFDAPPPAADFDFDAPPPAADFDFDAPPPAADFDFDAPPPTVDFDFDAPPPAPDFNFEGGSRPEDLPILQPSKEGDVTINDWGTLRSGLPTRNVPKTHLGNPFNPECYAKHNPEVATEVGNNADKLTAHWIDIGSKQGLNADCSNAPSSQEERLKMMEEQSKLMENYEGRKTNCAATDKFWIEQEKRCDGLRHSDGRPNAEAAKCAQERSNYVKQSKDHKAYCNRYRGLDSNIKSPEERCKMNNNHWERMNSRDGAYGCNRTKNVDGSTKTDADYCTGMNSYYNNDVCDVTKDRDGKDRSEEDLCLESNNFVDIDEMKFIAKNPELARDALNRIGIDVNRITAENLVNAPYVGHALLSVATPENSKGATRCNKLKYPDGTLKGKQEFCQNVLNGRLNVGPNTCVEIDGEYPADYEKLKQYLETKKLGDYTTVPYTVAIKPVKPGKAPPKNTPDEFGNITPPRFSIGLNFIQGNGKPQKSLTLYYADWCPHCHDMMPEWNKLKSKYKDVKIEKLEQKQTNVKVDGYPTIIFRDGNKMEVYDGERSKTAIVNYLKNKL